MELVTPNTAPTAIPWVVSHSGPAETTAGRESVPNRDAETNTLASTDASVPSDGLSHEQTRPRTSAPRAGVEV